MNSNTLSPRYLPATAPGGLLPIAPVGVSRLYPPDMVRALTDVENWPPLDRRTRINTLTAELHRRGLVRDPADDSMAQVWADRRTVAGLLR